MEKPSIFISYSSKELETAEVIQKELESSGFNVWRDKDRLETDWSQEIATALADSDVLCLLWCEQAAESKWVMHEWLTARALGKTIILCRLPEAPASPKPLHNLQEINFVNLQRGCRDLIGRLKSKSDYTKKFDYTVLPKNSYIPFSPTENFMGRKQDLLELYLKLIGNLNKIGINQVGAVGMGGIGKTQLVVEFAYRFSFAFDSVYWIQAGDEGKWLRQFVELARDRLQLSIASESEKPEANKQFIYALQKYCKDNPDTLIIMDNVTEPKLLNSDEFLFGVTPFTLGCDLLFTTRRHFELPGVSSQSVNILPQESAYKLLVAYRKPQTPDEEKHAASICNAVGYLPLAIILAGAFLKRYESATPFEDYHEELLKNRLDTIDIGKMSKEELATRHVAAVTTTLESQWEMLDDEDAQALFKLAGQFPEAEIIPKARMGLFGGIGRGKSKLDQPLAKAFNLLHDLNLVEKLESDVSAIRLHPLIHDFAIRLIPEEEAATFKYTAAKNLKTAIFEYSRLQNVLAKRGIKQLLGDMEVAIDWWGDDERNFRDLELLHGALRLSFNQLLKDSSQLITQLVGRLMSMKASGIHNLLEQAARGKRGLWLRPLTPSLTPPGDTLLRTLEGHSSSVQAVAIAQDGNTAVSGSGDKTLKIWDLKSGEVLQTLEGHSGSVQAVAIAQDGKTAVSGSGDKTLKIWDLKSGEVLQTLEGHSGSVQAVAIAPDGRTAVSASDATTLKVWDLKSGEVLQTLEKPSDYRVLAVAIAPDVKTAVSASGDSNLKVWDLCSGEDLQTLEGHRGWVTAVAMAPDGKTAVSASEDQTLKVWDLCSGEVRQTLKDWDHRSGENRQTSEGWDWILEVVNSVAISTDGKTVVSAAYKTLKVWDLCAAEVLHTLGRHSGSVHAVAISPDGKTAVSASEDKTLKVWEMYSSEFRQTVNTHSEEVTAVAIAPDGKTVVSASVDRTLKLWDLRSGELCQTLEGHSDWVTAVAIAPNGETAVSASADRTLKLWDLGSGELRLTLERHRHGVTAVEITSDSKTVVSASSGDVKIWDLQTGEVLNTQQGNGWVLTAVAISPDGKTEISASMDDTLRLWNLQNGKVYQILELHSGGFSAVASTPDDKTSVSVFGNDTLKLWNLNDSEVNQWLKEHDRWVTLTDQAIVPDGKIVVLPKGKTLTVWDLRVRARKEIAKFCGDSGIGACCISPDGKTIVAGEESGRMHFLRIEGLDYMVR